MDFAFLLICIMAVGSDGRGSFFCSGVGGGMLAEMCQRELRIAFRGCIFLFGGSLAPLDRWGGRKAAAAAAGEDGVDPECGSPCVYSIKFGYK